MSASIYWIKVIPNEGTSIDTMAPSHFMECFERAFGNWPILLRLDSLPVLYGMKACKVQGVEEVIEALEKNSVIKLWAEF